MCLGRFAADHPCRHFDGAQREVLHRSLERLAAQSVNHVPWYFYVLSGAFNFFY